jgi:hypothetical protein
VRVNGGRNPAGRELPGRARVDHLDRSLVVRRVTQLLEHPIAGDPDLLAQRVDRVVAPSGRLRGAGCDRRFRRDPSGPATVQVSDIALAEIGEGPDDARGIELRRRSVDDHEALSPQADRRQRHRPLLGTDYLEVHSLHRRRQGVRAQRQRTRDVTAVDDADASIDNLHAGLTQSRREPVDIDHQVGRVPAPGQRIVHGEDELRDGHRAVAVRVAVTRAGARGTSGQRVANRIHELGDRDHRVCVGITGAALCRRRGHCREQHPHRQREHEGEPAVHHVQTLQTANSNLQRAT